MSHEFDSRRLATLAFEIMQAIPRDGGIVHPEQYRDETIIKGDQTGLLLAASALLFSAIGHPEANNLEGRLNEIMPGHGLLYGWLLTPDEIEKEQRKLARSPKSDAGCLVLVIAAMAVTVILAVIGAVAIVRWLI